MGELSHSLFEILGEWSKQLKLTPEDHPQGNKGMHQKTRLRGQRHDGRRSSSAMPPVRGFLTQPLAKANDRTRKLGSHLAGDIETVFYAEQHGVLTLDSMKVAALDRACAHIALVCRDLIAALGLKDIRHRSSLSGTKIDRRRSWRFISYRTTASASSSTRSEAASVIVWNRRSKDPSRPAWAPNAASISSLYSANLPREASVDPQFLSMPQAAPQHRSD
ncbi:MAG: hypothetical protein AAF354_12895 [Pseudomonadota bacterium]